jgi:lipoate synthase
MDRALDILTATPPDVFNHNLENVPRVYRQVVRVQTITGPETAGTL